MNNKNRLMTLSVEEMKLIEKDFERSFPNRELTILHPHESHISHVDLGILYKEGSHSIIYTMGMSNFVMSDGTSCEIFVEVPNDMFKIPPTIKNCDENISPIDLINIKDYGFIVIDLLNIALMPSDGELYLSGDTLETNDRVYGLLEFFRNDNPYKNSKIKYMYLTQLQQNDLAKLNGKNREYHNDYFSKLIGPVRKI